jgi:GNAT superfamily N-acetyltransferase
VIVRVARPEDHAELGRITVAAYEADGYLHADDEYAEELRDTGRRAELATLLAAVDDGGAGPLLGTVTFCLPGTPYAEISRPGEAEFRMLAVAPGHRGRGVGGRLVRACLDLARTEGATGLALSSLEAMRPAHRIYERMGFQRAPERDWEPVPGLRLVAYLMPL